MMPAALEFSQVSVEYGRGAASVRAVDGVDLVVPRGSVVGLVGESGSGKSTLARAAIGLVPLAQGTVSSGGSPIPRRGRRNVQMVFQDATSALDPRMTIRATITEALSVAGTRASQREAEVTRLLEAVHLDPALATRLPAALSGGQRQRVSLARALAARPEVIVADEMTSALDVSVQGAILNLIRELRAEQDLSMLFISHNLAVVSYVCDVIAVMYLGRIVEVGPTEQLLADPQHPYTRLLLSTAPRIGTKVSMDLLPAQVRDAEPADPHQPPPGCRFHPRCPRGPLVRPERQNCSVDDPAGELHTATVAGPEVPGRTLPLLTPTHRAACWYPGADAEHDHDDDHDDPNQPQIQTRPELAQRRSHES